MKTILKTLCTVVLMVGLIHCSVEDAINSATDSTSSSSTTTETVSSTTGTLTAADGSAIAGASVALTQAGTTLQVKALAKTTSQNLTNKKGQYLPLFQTTDGDGETCDDISESLSGTVLATDCTSSDGTYNLSGEIPCGETLTLSAKKGSFFLSLSVTLSCGAEEDSVALEDIAFDDDCGQAADSLDSESCNFDIARMAVVTGTYDEIENVLAKLGFGEVDEYGFLDMLQPFDFTLIDGNDSLGEDYEDFDDFISDIENLNDYDIIFINCGNSNEDRLSDPDVVARLQQYVEEGGKLYVTDWSYDFLENPFPSFLNFLEGGEDPDTAEIHNDAQDGTGGITVDADVNNDVMASWLDGVTVNEGTIEEDCYGLDDDAINAHVGARNDDGTVTIGDFLGAWAVIEGIHDGFAESTNLWISGDISHSGGDLSGVPLTATKDVEEGRILYSSYHTAHSCTTPGFWPQERILQYLVFEL